MDINNSPTISGKPPKVANHEHDCGCRFCCPEMYEDDLTEREKFMIAITKAAERERCAKESRGADFKQPDIRHSRRDQERQVSKISTLVIAVFLAAVFYLWLFAR